MTTTFRNNRDLQSVIAFNRIKQFSQPALYDYCLHGYLYWKFSLKCLHQASRSTSEEFFQIGFDESRALFSTLFTLLFKRNPSLADTPTPPLLLFPWFSMQCTCPIPLTFPEYVLLHLALVFDFLQFLENILKLFLIKFLDSTVVFHPYTHPCWKKSSVQW